ncbi:hypothetical protein HAX54_013433 [Datura stramonium]|uniref:Uncharacterized protein n=1 Tax=Datura stramonium TaxID=4076 RepID=A0ABS8RYV7_DATST|nr:hypothetical protein [Datura stramonium]
MHDPLSDHCSTCRPGKEHVVVYNMQTDYVKLPRSLEPYVGSHHVLPITQNWWPTPEFPWIADQRRATVGGDNWVRCNWKRNTGFHLHRKELCAEITPGALFSLDGQQLVSDLNVQWTLSLDKEEDSALHMS